MSNSPRSLANCECTIKIESMSDVYTSKSEMEFPPNALFYPCGDIFFKGVLEKYFQLISINDNIV